MNLVALTQLSTLAGRLQQQSQLVEDQRHVHGVTPKSFNTKQESYSSFKLSCQE